MELKKQDVFIQVKDGKEGDGFEDIDGKFYFLEKVAQVYVLTEDELSEVIDTVLRNKKPVTELIKFLLNKL